MTKKSVNSKPPKPEYETKAMQETDSLTGSGRGWDRSEKIAKGEKKDWTNEEKSAQQKSENTVKELKSIGKIVRFLMFLFCGLFVVFLGSWAWHFIMPECWHWLKSDKINKIQSIIFSGSLGAMASIYFRGK